ncbi:MAG: hypothetical protein ACE5EY_06160 [Anaerolineae bacterium]
MTKTSLFLFLLVFLIAACSPPTAEPESANEPTTAPRAVPPTELPTATAVPVTDTPEPEPEVVTEVVSPGEVDLQAMTAVPIAPVTPKVAPAPGVPDPVEALTQVARQDLAGRLGVDVSEVARTAVESANWPSSALGCPEPDMAYLTVITPGYQITLSANGTEYTYHTDANRRVVLCGKDGKPVP